MLLHFGALLPEGKTVVVALVPCENRSESY